MGSIPVESWREACRYRVNFMWLMGEAQYAGPVPYRTVHLCLVEKCAEALDQGGGTSIQADGSAPPPPCRIIRIPQPKILILFMAAAGEKVRRNGHGNACPFTGTMESV